MTRRCVSWREWNGKVMPRPDLLHSGDQYRVIQARDLVRRFGKFVAVDHVDIELVRGEVLGLLGANGAGKTTTIRMLCGTLPPTSGRIEVAGVDMVRRARDARGHIGYVSQRFTLYDDLEVVENLRLQAGLYGVTGKRRQERIRWTLDHLDLAGLEKTMARDLPLGFKRRLALAAALLHEPQVLFLDEPTSGVDPSARQRFWELIYDLADSGIGILVTTHYMDEAMFCDRIAFMHTGKIITENTPAELIKQPLKNPLLELQARDCSRFVPILQALPQVMDIVPHAGKLRLRLMAGTDLEQAQQAIWKLAAERNMKLDRLAPARAELEDVFIATLETVDSGEAA